MPSLAFSVVLQLLLTRANDISRLRKVEGVDRATTFLTPNTIRHAAPDHQQPVSLDRDIGPLMKRIRPLTSPTPIQPNRLLEASFQQPVGFLNILNTFTLGLVPCYSSAMSGPASL